MVLDNFALPNRQADNREGTTENNTINPIGLIKENGEVTNQEDNIEERRLKIKYAFDGHYS